MAVIQWQSYCGSHSGQLPSSEVLELSKGELTLKVSVFKLDIEEYSFTLFEEASYTTGVLAVPVSQITFDILSVASVSLVSPQTFKKGSTVSFSKRPCNTF